MPPPGDEKTYSVQFKFYHQSKPLLRKMVGAIGRGQFADPDHIVKIKTDSPALLRIGIQHYYQFSSPLNVAVTEASKKGALDQLRSEFNAAIGSSFRAAPGTDYFTDKQAEFRCKELGKAKAETPPVARVVAKPPKPPKKPALPQPPKEKSYAVTFQLRDPSRESIEQIIAAIGHDRFATPDKISRIEVAEGQLPKGFPEGTKAFYKFSSPLKGERRSTNKPGDIATEVRAEFNAAVRANLPNAVEKNYFPKGDAAFRVTEILPEQETPLKLPKLPKPPKPKKNPVPHRPTAKKHWAAPPSREALLLQESRSLIRELLDHFPQSELASAARLSVCLEKNEAQNHVLLVRGGSEAEHTALRDRLTNNFFGKQETPTELVDDPIAKKAALAASSVAKKMDKKRSPNRLRGSGILDDAQAVSTTEVETPQMLQSRFELDGTFATRLKDKLGHKFVINESGDEFHVGAAKDKPRGIRIALMRDLGIPSKYDSKQNAPLLDEVAKLDQSDRRLLRELMRANRDQFRWFTSPDRLAAAKFGVIERALLHPEHLRKSNVPRELFMLHDEEKFLADAKPYLDGRLTHTPGTKVSGGGKRVVAGNLIETQSIHPPEEGIQY